MNGYLVILRLLGDDLPQRLFANREDALEFAHKFDAARPLTPVGGSVNGCRLLSGDKAVAVVEFQDGKPVGCDYVFRDDLPEKVGLAEA